MSQLFDSLRRGRRRELSGRSAARTAKADAVLATLGYRKKHPNSYKRPLLIAVIGVLIALTVAWFLWPRTSPRRGGRASPSAHQHIAHST